MATALKTIAGLAKVEIGLTVATADFGGWDTHDGQASRFQTRAARPPQAPAALHADLAGPGDRPGAKATALDLAISTDYRHVLAEVPVKRAGRTRIAVVFPTAGSGAPPGLA